MKTHLLLGALLCTRLLAAGEGYVNFVRQTQQNTGVVYSVSVTPEGSAASQGLLETGGALFQLWTIEQTTAKDYLLDQKLVGAYLPSATITIKTQDPYPTVPRTRADKPFTVTVNVAGLVTVGSNLPDAAKRVLLEQHVKNYTATKTSYTLAEATSATPKSSASIYTNGNTLLNFASTSLTGADPTKVSGEEWFVVHALADGSVAQSQIASGKVQIWPVASGSLAGITNNQNIRAKAPPITVTMNDLYPQSFTYVQVYPGSPQLGTKGARVPGTEKVHDGKTDLDLVLPNVSDYDNLFPTDGAYTMELVTETPFGTDRLAYLTFSVNRAIQVRGLLGGLDQ
jgi:hypothetical protein